MKKHSFSILELLVALFLTSLIVGASSFSLKSYLTKNQFEKEADILQGHLQLAYDLVLQYDIDLSILLHYEENTLVVELFSDALPFFTPKHKIKRFKHLNEVSLNLNPKGFLPQKINPSSPKKLTLQFSYYGGLMQPSNLEIKGSSNQMASFALQGFPHVITKEKKLLPTS